MKKYLLFLFSSLFLFGCPTKKEGCTNPNSFNFDPTAVSDDGSCKDKAGCLGYASGYANSGNEGISLGDAYWDQKMAEEVTLQRQFFQGIPANVFILYEPSVDQKNAYASPQGKILFGYYMFYYTINTYGALPVPGILAHEWGHRTQFTYGWQDYTKPAHKELEADAFSGFYMALMKQYAWASIESYYSNIYALGDYYFNSPQHHGTPDQRLAAAYLGVETAIEVLQTGNARSYQELHTIFMDEIKTNIDAKKMKSFNKITYPSGLSSEYLKSLFPHK